MINTGEFRNLIREIVRDEIGDKSLYKIGEVASIGDKVTVIFSGEPEPSQKQYTYLKSYSPGLGDRVILMKDKGTYVVLGKIGERGGGITFGEHLAEDAQKHITESGENTNGRYVKFDDGTQICWRNTEVSGDSWSNSAWGGKYKNAVVNLPVPFVGIARPIYSNQDGQIGGRGSWSTNTTMSGTSAVNIWLGAFGSNASVVKGNLIVIGRWK